MANGVEDLRNALESLRGAAASAASRANSRLDELERKLAASEPDTTELEESVRSIRDDIVPMLEGIANAAPTAEDTAGGSTAPPAPPQPGEPGVTAGQDGTPSNGEGVPSSPTS